MTPELSRRRHRVAVVAVVAALGACFWGLLGPFDLLTFLHAGRSVIHGHSPYSPTTTSLFQSGHAFVYPSFVAWLFAPLALMPTHLAIDAYMLASVVAIVLAARWLGRTDELAAALLLVSAPTIIALQVGTLNPFLFLGIAASWRLSSRRPGLAGVFLGLVSAAKLFLLPLLLWPLIRRRWGQVSAAGGVLAAAVAGQALLGGSGLSGYASMLSQLQRLESVRSWSLTSLLQSLGVAGHASSDLAVLVGAFGLLMLWYWRYKLNDAQILGLVVLASLLVSPIVWSSYLLLVAVPLLLWSRGYLTLSIAAVGSWVLVTPDAASPVRTMLGFGLALLTATVAVWTQRHRLRKIRRPHLRLTARQVAATALVAAGGVVLLLVPASVRNALPALMAEVAIAAWGIVRPAPAAARRGSWR